MTQVASFTFSPFSENTYVLFDETKECVIIDPGCYDQAERQQLVGFIEAAGLKPVRLLNTHCHLDHIFGNKFVCEKYDLLPEMHQGEIEVMKYSYMAAERYGVQLEESPMPTVFWEEGDVVTFGDTKLEVLFVPGHSPASICFYCPASNFVIAGDTLFQGSVGRTDLPGGDMNTLFTNIQTKLFALPDETVVYAGHMDKTTIGEERLYNPFVGRNA